MNPPRFAPPHPSSAAHKTKILAPVLRTSEEAYASAEKYVSGFVVTAAFLTVYTGDHYNTVAYITADIVAASLFL